MRPADARAMDQLELGLQRTRMVHEHLALRGIADRRVLAAFRAVPREEFVPERVRELAYTDEPLPIGEGQTISQPYIVALMAEALALEGTERVLDVGTGSGYGAAILSRLATKVFTVERFPALAASARARLARLGYDNVEVHCGDGSLGLAEHAPFDAISVGASAPTVPQPLLDQLAPGGRLVIPIGPDHTQTLVRITRMGPDALRREAIADVRFVPLVGDRAWH